MINGVILKSAIKKVMHFIGRTPLKTLVKRGNKVRVQNKGISDTAIIFQGLRWRE